MGRDAVRRAVGSHPGGWERRSGLKIRDRGSREPLRVARVRCSFGMGGHSHPPGVGVPQAEPHTRYGDVWSDACCNQGFGTLCPRAELGKFLWP